MSPRRSSSPARRHPSSILERIWGDPAGALSWAQCSTASRNDPGAGTYLLLQTRREPTLASTLQRPQRPPSFLPRSWAPSKVPVHTSKPAPTPTRLPPAPPAPAPPVGPGMSQSRRGASCSPSQPPGAAGSHRSRCPRAAPAAPRARTGAAGRSASRRPPLLRRRGLPPSPPQTELRSAPCSRLPAPGRFARFPPRPRTPAPQAWPPPIGSASC